MLGLGDGFGLLCPLLRLRFGLDLGLGFDLGLRFGLGHCRLGAPIGGLFALGRIVEETSECSAEQGRDHPSTLGDELPDRAGRRTRDDDDTDHADGEQDHRCAGRIGKGVQDAPDGHPEGTAGGADLSDRIVEAGPTPEDVKEAGCGDQGGQAAHGDTSEAIEIAVGVVVLAAHDETDTDPDEGDGHDRPGEAHPKGEAIVEDLADEPCAAEPHGEGGEHAEEEGADPPDVVSMVGHDRPEGITRRSGATALRSGLFLCGRARRRPVLRRLL